MIAITGLSYSYHESLQALRDIHLSVCSGERVALVGPNGAGKSTLLLHLNGILRGTGRIQIDGLELNEKNLPVIRAKVGMVFQSPDDQLFSATVFDDVAFGPIYQGLPKQTIQNRVDESLKHVGMADAGSRAPYHLSLGEKKRVALATVLSMQPEILALDEPTSGLDPNGKREFLDLIGKMPQTMLIATHDMHLAKALCPRLVVMDAGSIVFDGEIKEAAGNRSLSDRLGMDWFS